MSKIPYLEIKFKNEVDLVDKLLRLYDLSKEGGNELADKKKIKPLRKFERDILNYYIRYGYSKETKDIIEQDTGKTTNSVIQADFQLKERGYLEEHYGNHRKKKLNDTLQSIREDFILKKNRAYGLWFESE